MKNPSDLLDRIFLNPFLCTLIPTVNGIVTLIAQRRVVRTFYDRATRLYSSREGDLFLIFDNRPAWNLSFSRLERSLSEIACRFYWPKAGDTVIDIGAGVGSETVVFSKLVGRSGKVVSVEAHPRTHSFLLSLIRANSMDNVVPLHVAVSRCCPRFR